MLDPSIITSLEIPLPPEPSRVVEERVWLSDGGEKAQRGINRIVAQYEADAARWLKTIDDTVAGYARVAQDDPASAELMASFGEEIAQIEALAEVRTLWRARFLKRSERDVKHWFKVDPSIGAVARSANARLLAADDRVIAGLLDFALFLRSVRSERDPAPVVSEVFDDPHEMLRSLRAAVAA